MDLAGFIDAAPSRHPPAALRRWRWSPARARSRPILRNHLVTVRSASEILATLDETGALEGVPFMPEMAAFCGATLPAHRRANLTCVEGLGLRRLQRTVFLDAARCDGAAHDGCQRNCLIFWKEAWLRPEGEAPPPPDPAREAAAIATIASFPTRGEGAYRCQSTALATATSPRSRWEVLHAARDVWLGEISASAFVSNLARAVANRILRRIGRPDLGVLTGNAERPSHGALNLEPGDWVRVKGRGALRPFLTPDSRNGGLSFEPEMTRYAGEARQVEFRVERIIHEETGKMVALKNTVGLKGVTCQGRCVRNCPRANPLYWRESWLERL